MNPRAKAAHILNQVITEHRSLAFSSSEEALTKELCFGTLRWYDRLLAVSNMLLFKPLKSKDQDITNLILIGLYQLIYSHIPQHAAVSETVSATRALSKPWASALVNKTLRRFLSEKEHLLNTIDKNISAQYAHPRWLIETIQKAWPNQWQNILKANNARPPLFLRINKTKITRSQYLDLLNQHNIDAQAIEDLTTAIKIEKPLPVNKLPGFSEGLFSVQDIAGQHVAPLLDLQPQHRVLDACAAPGSKTSHILEIIPQLKKLTAVDIDAQRLTKIKENITRLQLSHYNLALVLADVSHTKQWWDGVLFDRILLDAPCSATGVIRRHPDIKQLRQEHDIDQQAQIQIHLLNSLWPLLAPKGKLLYTTCSILPQENEHVLNQFLKQHPEAKQEKVEIHGSIERIVGYQQITTKDGSDGFYYASILNSHS